MLYLQEFRGFVSNGSLNALSQYNHLVFFPSLVARKDEIATTITKFFNDAIIPRLAGLKLASGVPLDSYVIDFGLVESIGTTSVVASDSAERSGQPRDQIQVIELNPFLPTTDGCLFSWDTERGLLDGSSGSGFQFRICEAPRRGASSLISKDWKALLQSESAGAWQAAGAVSR